MHRGGDQHPLRIENVTLVDGTGAGPLHGALTSSHGLKPCDSRFTLPLPQRGHQRRSAGLRPTGSDGSPRTRQAAPAGLAG